MNIVLLGYMGSGKSTIGKALSEVLQMDYIDLDHFIETKEGMTISELFSSKGEIYFRKKEAYYLNTVLSSGPSKILATGGGTPCYGNVMNDLKENSNVLTVFLRCSIETLTDRLWRERESRPLIAHLDSKELLNDFIRKHLFERNHYYNQASIILDANSNEIDEIVESLVLKLF